MDLMDLMDLVDLMDLMDSCLCSTAAQGGSRPQPGLVHFLCQTFTLRVNG